MASIDPSNPFQFPENCLTGPAWAQGQINNQGGTSTDHNVQVGCNNTADNWGTPNSSFYSGQNGGSSQTSSDICGDPTVVNTAVQFNPTLVADNIFTGQGSIGLYGRSRGAGTFQNSSPPSPFACPTAGDPPVQAQQNDWSVGVLGQSSKGCGVYGLATDEEPTTDQPSHGIGVVGRSAGGEALENVSVEQIMGQVHNFPAVPGVPPDLALGDGAIGVLGQSLRGPGVRGHGGPLSLVLPTGTPPVLPPPGPAPSNPASPGGVFSSGPREIFTINASDGPTAEVAQEVGGDSCAQLRLVPSVGTELPKIAQIGDLFLQLSSPGNAAAAQLWICTGYLGLQSPQNPATPWWRPLLMGPAVEGGQKAPPPSS